MTGTAAQVDLLALELTILAVMFITASSLLLAFDHSPSVVLDSASAYLSHVLGK